MLESLKNICRTPVQILNQPAVKNGVKQGVGVCTFAFGIFELYDIARVGMRRRINEVTTIEGYDGTVWRLSAIRTSWKMDDYVALSGRFSRLFSAVVSPSGVYLITKGVHCVFNTAQLERVFGRNTIFAINPRHPRHIVSIVAVILALPPIAQSVYYCFAERRVRQTPTERLQTAMLFFNTLTSRPVLHLANLALH